MIINLIKIKKNRRWNLATLRQISLSWRINQWLKSQNSIIKSLNYQKLNNYLKFIIFCSSIKMIAIMNEFLKTTFILLFIFHLLS